MLLKERLSTCKGRLQAAINEVNYIEDWEMFKNWRNKMSDYDFLEEATVVAAQCWCDEESGYPVMDVKLGEVFAKHLSFWMQTAAQNQRNADYYRGLLERCGAIIGDRAYLCDDGSKSQDVLCAKIPEIISEDYVNGG